MNKNTQSCGGCYYFKEKGIKQPSKGYCCFNPPTHIIETKARNCISYGGVWPEVFKDDWCGKYMDAIAK